MQLNQSIRVHSKTENKNTTQTTADPRIITMCTKCVDHTIPSHSDNEICKTFTHKTKLQGGIRFDCLRFGPYQLSVLCPTQFIWWGVGREAMKEGCTVNNLFTNAVFFTGFSRFGKCGAYGNSTPRTRKPDKFALKRGKIEPTNQRK